jgi:transcriptional regulator with XRE-family HTH domain
VSFDAEGLFALRLRQFRQARGWTQADVSRRLATFGCRLDQSSLARVENGHRRIQLNEAFALAALFGLEIERLLEGIHCDVCLDYPPAGFACEKCGATHDPNFSRPMWNSHTDEGSAQAS